MCWERLCGGANEFKFLLDDISFTFLYVSSSDLVLNEKLQVIIILYSTNVLKNKKTETFLYMPKPCEMEMTHTKIRSFRRKDIVCSAIVPIG